MADTRDHQAEHPDPAPNETEVEAYLRRAVPAELVAAMRRDPEALRLALGEMPPDDLAQALREEAPPALVDALREDPEALRAGFERLDPAERADLFRGEPSPAMGQAIRALHLDVRERDLTSFICFAGYPRSGGSIVGALLDAHPNLVVAHELALFTTTPDGEPTDQLAYTDRQTLLVDTVAFAARNARHGRTGQRVREDGSRYYSTYEVEGGWHGRHERLLAAGSKNAVESAMASEKHGVAPFHALEELVRLPLRFVHVVRDRYDNIATMRRVHGDRAPMRFEKRLVGVQRLKDAGFAMIDVHLDDVVDDTRREVGRLCEWFGVPVLDNHLDGCAAVVSSTPSRTREGVEWSDGDRRTIERLMDTYPWLHRYRSDGSPPQQ